MSFPQNKKNIAMMHRFFLVVSSRKTGKDRKYYSAIDTFFLKSSLPCYKKEAVKLKSPMRAVHESIDNIAEKIDVFISRCLFNFYRRSHKKPVQLVVDKVVVYLNL